MMTARERTQKKVCPELFFGVCHPYPYITHTHDTRIPDARHTQIEEKKAAAAAEAKRKQEEEDAKFAAEHGSHKPKTNKNKKVRVYMCVRACVYACVIDAT